MFLPQRMSSILSPKIEHRLSYCMSCEELHQTAGNHQTFIRNQEHVPGKMHHARKPRTWPSTRDEERHCHVNLAADRGPSTSCPSRDARTGSTVTASSTACILIIPRCIALLDALTLDSRPKIQVSLTKWPLSRTVLSTQSPSSTRRCVSSDCVVCWCLVSFSVVSFRRSHCCRLCG